MDKPASFHLNTWHLLSWQPPAYKVLGGFKIPFFFLFFLKNKVFFKLFPIISSTNMLSFNFRNGMCLILILHLCSVEETCIADNKRQTSSYLKYDLCSVYIFSGTSHSKLVTTWFCKVFCLVFFSFGFYICNVVSPAKAAGRITRLLSQ